jgi:8-oxo-dGTP pyrophosphatase MutT (NUDIX family)
MRLSEAAVALIRREQDGRTSWLAQWNRNWQAYHFVGGHRRPGESFRDCLVREIAEELHLREGNDYNATAGPLARLDYRAFSESARTETRYITELYEVDLTGDARAIVDGDPRNRWLDEAEIAGERCRDGRPVSATMQRLLDAVRTPRDPG